MTELNVPDPEELMVCPYDKVHMIRAKRFQYHLMKCRKNWPGSEFAVCPFNAKHEMPKPELRYHMATCTDRSVLEKDIAHERSRMNGEGTLFKGCTDVPAYSTNNFSDESWDLEMNTCPRIGVDPEFFERFKYIDRTGYNTAAKKAYYDNLKAEFTGQKVKRPGAGKNPSTNKLRLPQNESKASKLSAFPEPVQHPSNVFAYSLSMAGIGRGKSKGALGQQEVGASRFNMGLGRGVPVGIRELVVESKEPRFVVPTVKPALNKEGGKDIVLLRQGLFASDLGKSTTDTPVADDIQSAE